MYIYQNNGEIKMPEISKEEYEELKRLREVEKSVIAGLKEESFSQKAIELFRERKNFVLPDDSLRDNADLKGSFTGACGDHIEIYLQTEMDKITDAKFTTDGCPGAVTSAAALTEIAKGKKTYQASKLEVQNVVEYLNEGARGLPKSMHDCCAIAIEALKDATNEQ